MDLCAAVPNFAVLEYRGQDVPFWGDLIVGPELPFIQNDSLAVSDAPGLGAELNEEVARQYAKPGELFFEA